MLDDILGYIRNWFSFPSESRQTKRRAPSDDYEHFTPNSKIRKMSGPFADDPWALSNFSSKLPSRSDYITQRPQLINLADSDGDDDVIEVKPSESNTHSLKRTGKTPNLTSTPVEVKRLLTNGVAQPKQACNGTRISDKLSPIFNSISNPKSNSKSHKPFMQSSILEQSIRLDEKLRYKEMLENSSPTTLFYNNSFSKYQTPVGKIYTFEAPRSRRMLHAVRNGGKPVESIDLTRPIKPMKPKLSTKDTILKILDDDREPIEIKDSDSDIEIVSPPTPPPDIKVDPVNTLKATMIDTSEISQPKWLQEFNQKHQDHIAGREKVIRELTEHAKRLREINNEMRVKFLEHDIRECLSIKEAIVPVVIIPEEPELPELTEAQEKTVARVWSSSLSQNEVLVKNFGLNITRRDLKTLANLNWLNDEVINFYMNLLMERGKDSKWPNVYAFNTFFYPKLIKDGHASLRRWTRKVDIFSYDIIAVPIHLGMHWCMSIIDLRAKHIKYYDSMGGSNRQCLEALLEYLVEEHKDKKKASYDVSDWQLENMKDIPQQMNGSDCGMFSCTFAEYLTRDAKLTFSQQDMPYFRRKMVVEIMESRLLIS